MSDEVATIEHLREQVRSISRLAAEARGERDQALADLAAARAEVERYKKIEKAATSWPLKGIAGWGTAIARTERDEALAEVERLKSWDGLLSILDEHYPAEVFEKSADPGARIVTLTRHLAAAREDIEDYRRRLKATSDAYNEKANDLATAAEVAARFREALEDIRWARGSVKIGAPEPWREIADAALTGREPEGADAIAWVVAMRRKAAAERAALVRKDGDVR